MPAMKYKVEGADAKTGKSRVLRIDADNEKQAAIRAHDMGVLVSAIYPRPDGINSEKEIALSELNTSPPRPAAAPMPMPVPTITAEPRKAVVVSPEYGGLRAASIVLHILALLAYIVGLLTLFVAIYTIIHYDMNTSKFVFAMAGSAIVSGAILHGMSASCDALRDIAQNSFRK
jgi:hypothetical protein